MFAIPGVDLCLKAARDRCYLRDGAIALSRHTCTRSIKRDEKRSGRTESFPSVSAETESNVVLIAASIDKSSRGASSASCPYYSVHVRARPPVAPSSEARARTHRETRFLEAAVMSRARVSVHEGREKAARERESPLGDRTRGLRGRGRDRAKVRATRRAER